MVEANRCMAALAATYEMLMKECGNKKPKVIFLGEEGFIITNPPEEAVAVPKELPWEERVRIVAESRWAQNLAKGICHKFVGLTPDTTEYRKCVENVSRKVAEGVLKE
jgi:hypothetical protein